MRSVRLCVVVGILTGLALTVVVLRAEQTRGTAEVLKQEARWVQLRREWWAIQTRAARQRTPQRVRRRVDSLNERLNASGAGGSDVPTRFASQVDE